MTVVIQMTYKLLLTKNKVLNIQKSYQNLKIFMLEMKIVPNSHSIPVQLLLSLTKVRAKFFLNFSRA